MLRIKENVERFSRKKEIKLPLKKTNVSDVVCAVSILGRPFFFSFTTVTQVYKN